jgi:lipopolysaccharide export system protein LptC
MAYNPHTPMEARKRLAWTIACERAVVTKEDAVLLYEKMMKEMEATDKRNKYKETESNKS